MKKIFIIGGVIIVVLIFGSYLYFGRKVTTQYEYATAKRGDLVQEVSVTGKVKPASAVNLAFEKSGKVARVGAGVGDKVKAGQVLAELDSADAAAQVAQADAAAESARAKLAELKKGARAEELRVAETKVTNAESALADAQLNLENVNQKADADILDDYDSALTAAAKSLSVATHALFTITDIQNAHFANYDQQSAGVADTKATAVLDFLGAAGAGRASNDYLSQLDGGAKLAVGNAQNNPTDENIDSALERLKNSLQKIKSALDAIPLISQFTSTEASNLNTEKSNIDGEISAISAKQQAIAVQKTVNQNAIDSAQAGVNSAANALESAKDELALKKAGASAEAIAASEAQAKEAEAQTRVARAQLAKTILRSPFDGVVTKQNAKIGEVVSANAALISVISGADFELETNVSEADIAKVEIGDAAKITLDAYGSDVVFDARVAAVDPAETLVENIATYKTTLVFAKNDGRVKSGMTANIDIATARRENVIFIPQRAVVKKESSSVVFTESALGVPQERPVKLGLISSDGNVEVTEGLKEGDRVVALPEKLTADN